MEDDSELVESADTDCMGSKSRQYNHIFGLEYTCTGAALCPIPTDQLCSIGAESPPSIYNLGITYFMALPFYFFAIKSLKY